MPSYTDGNFASAYLIDKQIGYPLNVPGNGGTREYRLTYIQNANTYADAAIGDTDANAPGGYLVEQGPVTLLAGGVVQFTRVFSEVPTTWTQPEQIAYAFPGLTLGSGTTWEPYGRRQPITLFALATVTHTYSQGSAPTADTVFTVTDQGNVVDYIGTANPALGGVLTSPSIEPATYTVSSDVVLWRGNIWEKITKTVPRPA